MALIIQNFIIGEKVKHKARAEWGVGEITKVDYCGTIRVIFQGRREMSIAQGAKYLKKVP
ncbi:MAG: hypothetical protein P8X86_12340 [Desulfofustis sp.]|jgi:transcription elongation factor GreA-like protein